MSISESIGQAKKELSGDEQILVSAFKLEKIYKKYKKVIWGAVIILLVFFTGNAVKNAMQEATLEKANEAFLVLQANPEDAKALQLLKDNNPALFELFSFAQAIKKNDANALASLSQSKNEVISDSSKYAQKVLTNESADSALYKEIALLESAYLAIKAGDTKQAKIHLDSIDERSSIGLFASLLKHSIIKVK
ncbi:MAG: hypothetical protein PHR75_00100 [Sulfurovum sp.]|nr:hypothetical protein [Sulfurovum sp.]MDD3602083.1 hypothetical protein [Sulfurovum sp.]